MTLKPKSYQNATLSIEKTMWRICWYNTNPKTGQLERIRRTFNLNRIKDKAERREAANDLIFHINHLLRVGYNDFLTPEENAAILGFDPIQTEATIAPAQPVVTVVAALERALKIRQLGKAQRTAGTYRSFVTRLVEWLTDNELNILPVQDFTGEHWQEFMYYKAGLGHGNRNINDYTNFFKTTFETIRRKLKLIQENPLAETDYLPEKESTRFEPLTAEEIERIVPALLAYNPRFYLYTKFIAYQFIRPWHIARLKAGDIDYTKNCIHVADDTTKNRKSRYKQLLQPVKTMLQQQGCHTLPQDYYLFSNADFAPGRQLYQNLSIRAAETWKRIVIDGLGINKKMYALKHTSSQYFVNENENADLKFLQQHMEHHSITQTEVYLQNKVFKKIDEEKVKLLNY